MKITAGVFLSLILVIIYTLPAMSLVAVEDKEAYFAAAAQVNDRAAQCRLAHPDFSDPRAMDFSISNHCNRLALPKKCRQYHRDFAVGLYFEESYELAEQRVTCLLYCYKANYFSKKFGECSTGVD